MALITLDRAIEHGRCVAVRLGPPSEPPATELLDRLLPEERAFAENLAPRRRHTWIGGRAALREALERIGVDAGPVLANPRGAPLLPEGVLGSISHKDSIAVALVHRAGRARAEERVAIGIDVESDKPPRENIARLILREEELAELAPLAGTEDFGRELILRFSLKESIYKAIDPFVQRYVEFKEARVTPAQDGSAEAVMHLDPSKCEGAFDVSLRWMRVDGMVLTSARVARWLRTSAP